MCNTLFIGEKEITTPREFADHFGFMPEKSPYFAEINYNACLCQVDIQKAFREHGIAFKIEFGDFYVKQNENRE